MRILRNSVLFLVLVFLSACNENKIAKSQDQIYTKTPEPIEYKDSVGVEKDIEEEKWDTSLHSFSERVIRAIAEKDFEKLSAYVSDKGLQFSPYQYVENVNILFTPEDLLKESTRDSLIVWGVYDGSGEDIKYSFNEYYKHFIYNTDFVSIEPNYKGFKSSGNTLNNIESFYPNSFVVEYYFPGTKEYEQMDWSALFLIFEKSANEYRLRGIVHGQWTI